MDRVEPYRLWTPDEVFTIPPPEWAIENVLIEGGSALLWGPTNVGKSLLALEWAIRMATGLDWHRQEVVEPQRVAYLYSEGAAGLQLRYWAYLEALDLGHYAGLLRQNLRFLALDESIVLTPGQNGAFTKAQERLLYTFSQWAPHFVFFDPVQEVFAGIDNKDDAQVGKVFKLRDRLAKEFGTGSVFIHHANKGEHAFRGVTTWQDLVDTAFHIWNPEPDKPQRVKLETTKNRHGSRDIFWTMDIKEVLIEKHETLAGRTSAMFGSVGAGRTDNTSPKDRLVEYLRDGPQRHQAIETAGHNKNLVSKGLAEGWLEKVDQEDRFSPIRLVEPDEPDTL